MKEHHLSVVTLEEYEPNREFVGRNFNAGEVIQLVLKSARPPHRWLPFRYVQMVMMHELAHCKQMNHSRAFWAVRNQYAAAMSGLWSKGYTGEGIWGRGAALGSGAWDADTVGEGEPLPEHLCGGTYRSRRRGRKRKSKLSWKEQKERRIAKKFGVNGVALGADETEKVKLERGKKVAGKPRVAGSARGRELRAAAALARFDKQKVEVVDEELPLKEEEGVRILGSDEETASGSDYEDGEEEDDGNDALDLDGSRMKDKEGRALVKVCEDEDANDPSARNELDELRDVFRQPNTVKNETTDGLTSTPSSASAAPRVKREPGNEGASTARGVPPARPSPDAAPKKPLSLYDIPDIRDAVRPPPRATTSTVPRTATRPAITIHRLPSSTTPAGVQKGPTKTATSKSTTPKAAAPTAATSTATTATPTTQTEEPPAPRQQPTAGTGICPLCSLENDPAALSCAACANVLRRDAVKGSWGCGGEACRGTGYVNAGDCGVCGLCGGRRP